MCDVPSTAAIGRDERSATRRQMSCRPGGAVSLFFACRLIWGCFSFPAGPPVQGLRHSADEAAITFEAGASDDQPPGRDFVLPDVLAVIAAPHLDDGEDGSNLALD